MEKRITLKLATMNDAAILLQWRNDPRTRNASHNSEIIKMGDHLVWLSKTLNNPDRKLYIAWEKITDHDDPKYVEISIVRPVGTVRVDWDKLTGIYELSWTVAPEARNKDIGKKIVAMVANQLENKCIRAEMKSSNLASIKIAEFIGMKLLHKENANNVLHYFRKGNI